MIQQTLKETYEKFSPIEKDRFWKDVGAVLHWRGWNRDQRGSREVDDIASLFAEHEVELMEYT